MTDFSLYLHIPFCRRLCPYCAFSKTPFRGPAEAEELIDALLIEAATRAGEEPWRGGCIVTVFLGGGTPSLLTGAQVLRLLDGLRSLFPFAPDAEISLEANPGTLDEEKLEGWRGAGINRVSLGVQALDGASLRRLGRDHSPEEARDAVEKLRRWGVDSLNLDLMYGFNPGPLAGGARREGARRNGAPPLPAGDESMEKPGAGGTPGPDPGAIALWERTLEEALALRPDHVSAYGLTLEEDTAFMRGTRKGLRFTTGEETGLAQYRAAMERLQAAGLPQYEISNWARPGHRCRHNLLTWRGKPYLGLGPAAHSHDGDALRTWNEFHTDAWLRTVAARGRGLGGSERLTPEQRFYETVSLGLRLVEGIDEDLLAGRADDAGYAWPPGRLADLLERGLLERAGGRLRLTPLGRPLADAIEVDLVR